MNAKDLMIGDWVRQDGCTTPSCVAGVTCGKIHTWWADGTKHAKDQTYFSPIPLTPEILEKNGYEKYYMYHTLHLSQVMIEYYWHESRLEIRPYDAEPMVKIAPIFRVHELQHVLRLCGLNVLADNFKV